MANVVFPDSPSPFYNPAAHTEALKARGPERREKNGPVKKRPFSFFFEKASAPEELPASEESLHLLLDGVHNAGDALAKRPFPDEIKAYKQAVRNFVHYIVENCFAAEEHQSGANLLRRKKFTLVQIIDQKLEELASAVLQGQSDQLSILARTDEIRGLLIDLST